MPYNDLKCKVEKLTQLSDKQEREIISKLQDHMTCFLENYYIVANGVSIYPLWVECYYYNQSVFEDESVHGAKTNNEYARKMQSNRFGKIYVHKNDWGIDVCLSLGDYCLSLLIKCAIIDNEFKSQSYIAKAVCNNCNYDECQTVDKDCIFSKENSNIVLNKRIKAVNSANILKTVRVGLNKTKKHNDALLAAFIYDKDVVKEYRWATGFAKQWTLSINGMLHNWDYDKTCQEYQYSIERAYWDTAKEYMNSKETD